VKIVWAHTGFSTAPEMIEQYLKKYPNLWASCPTATTSPRPAGSSPPGAACSSNTRPLHRRLRHLGERALGPVRLDHERLRDWLAELPQDVAEKIAYRNAERLFRR